MAEKYYFAKIPVDETTNGKDKELITKSIHILIFNLFAQEAYQSVLTKIEVFTLILYF